MTSGSKHLKGILETAFGVLVLTPDALLIRLVQTDVWTLLFWRGLLQGITLVLYYLVAHKKGPVTTFRSIGRAGWLIAVLYAAGNICFISSIRLTAVANTLLIVASAPLLAAIVSWFVLKERIPLRTWGAAFAGLAGVGVIFFGGIGGLSLGGDVLAFGAAVIQAFCFVTIRKSKGISMVPAVALCGFIMAVTLLPLATPLDVSRMDATYLFILGCVIMPISFGLITLGPRFLTAPEVSLIMLGETILGPVWVWFFLGEVPPEATLWGGLIVLGTLVAHSVLGLRADRGARPS